MGEEFNFDEIIAQRGDFGPKSSSYASKTYRPNEWIVTLRLTDLAGARFETLEDEDGKNEEGVFIPIVKSGLFITPKKNAIVNLHAVLSEVPSKKYTHLMTQMMAPDLVAARKALGYKMGYVGFMKPTGFKKK